LENILKTKVYLNILNEQQKELLPLLDNFSKDYYLVGGTAIALFLGHRESIDFDLFTFKEKNQNNTISLLRKLTNKQIHTIHISKEQSHFIIDSVKFTFFNFPYKIKSKAVFNEVRIPDLLSLAAMKALALGGRAKWKDYVDLYFILKSGINLEEIIVKASELFNSENTYVFNRRIFLEQLSFYDDVNYEEKVFYSSELAPSDDEIKNYLNEISIEYLKKQL